jgi:hypothetical protein
LTSFKNWQCNLQIYIGTYQRIWIIIEDKAPNNDDYFGDKSVMISKFPQRLGRVNNYVGFAYISHMYIPSKTQSSTLHLNFDASFKNF